MWVNILKNFDLVTPVTNTMKKIIFPNYENIVKSQHLLDNKLYVNIKKNLHICLFWLPASL